MRKAALITGSAKRLGAYIANVLAMHGYDIVIHYNRSCEDAFSLREKLRNDYGISVELYQEDFLASNDLSKIIEYSFQIFPHLCLLVNNASFFLQDNFGSDVERLFDVYYKIHVRVPLSLMRHFSKREPKNGKIINIIDKLINRKSSNKYFSYLFSKKCLFQLTQMVDDYMSSKGMKVYAIHPGIVIMEDGGYNYNELKKLGDELVKAITN
ncbi:short chain dehydrogenase family protein [Neorickettsia helminthoeca str. Oregon]|uniref:Short chain dehydrogenase family protein n=1 Tax=Neorickettsia helminthoeca str. Oregon TaxID=1286528 RepID=X5HL62_9RICK|nr:SDR family NAD(P)-dependent oxidoreductase [Neorickettsia helminthoeca]AHX11844.1 short chain dehydrogenase family protein [Neorickettsia helminthoeca str. Oregon]